MAHDSIIEHVQQSGTTSWRANIDEKSWNGLISAWFGWMFDGVETYAMVAVAAVAIKQLIEPSQLPNLSMYISGLFAIQLTGWATGGMIAGVLADYIGRKRVMLYAIIAYAALAVVSALSPTYWFLFASRFLMGIALGGEFGAGASLTSELWPPAVRGRVLGIISAAFGIGFFIVALIWLFVGQLGPSAWRIMFAIGVLPAFLAIFIRSRVSEPEIWVKSNAKRRQLAERKKRGERIDEADQHLLRFSGAAVFTDPVVRRRVIPLVFMMFSSLIGFWAVSTWIPQYAGALAAKHGLEPQHWASMTALFYTFGGTVGYASMGFAADAWGRKPTMWAWYLIALIMVPVTFFGVQNNMVLLWVAGINGFFTLGQLSWPTIYLPEVFPTALRVTALSFVFNITRYLVALTTFFAGALAVWFGGVAPAATIIGTIYILGLVVSPFAGPETRNKPLPT
jgi:MFS family permease